MSKSHINVVLDLETLGLAEDAAILQIGCCIPNFDRIWLPKGISPEFEVTIAYEDAINSEFSKDSSTLDWWEKQSGAAKKSVFSGQESYEDALDQFVFWIASLKSSGAEINLWGNGPEFDNRLLDYTLQAYNYSNVWEFRNNHSMRTLKLLFPQTITEDPENEIKHTALGDARYEARLMNTIRNNFMYAGDML